MPEIFKCPLTGEDCEFGCTDKCIGQPLSREITIAALTTIRRLTEKFSGYSSLVDPKLREKFRIFLRDQVLKNLQK